MFERHVKIARIVLISAGLIALSQSSGGGEIPESFPVTPKAVASNRFRLEVGGKSVFVQKHKDFHYAHFPFSGAGRAPVTVTARRVFETMDLSPKSAGIRGIADQESLTFRFDLPGTGHWVVTMDGRERLFIFAEAPQAKPGETISVLDHGADATGKTLSTKAIQAAIDQAPAGATVTVPPGHYLSGTLFIRSGINLFVEAGALLQASGDPKRFEPLQNAFIVIENARDVTLKGRGTVDGSGAYLRHLTGESGRLLAIRDSRNVTVDGLVLRNPRAWHTHIVRSEHVTLRNVKVLTDRYVFNTDGINPDSSRHVLIEGNFFYCGDDAVAVKSTDRDGRFEDVYDITVRDNVMLTKKSALKVGTETHAAEMRDILFAGNQVIESDRGMALYARDGTHMHGIRFVGNRFERPYPDYQQRLLDFRITQRHGRSRISDVLIKDNVADGRWAQASLIRGLGEDAGISGIVFDNLAYGGKQCRSPEDLGLEIGPFARDISFK